MAVRIQAVTGRQVRGRVAIRAFKTNKNVRGENPIPVYKVSSAELVENGGYFLVSGNPASQFLVYEATGESVRGGPALPIYIVNDVTPPATYLDTILALGPIAYYPLNELSGVTADNAEGTAAYDGSYSNVTLDNADSPITGNRAGSWNGTTSYCDVYSDSFRDNAFNVAEGSLGIFLQVSALGIWTDGTSRRIIGYQRDGNNRIVINRSTVNNTLRFIYEANSIAEIVDTTVAGGRTDWIHAMITWSVANDRVRAYIDGAQIGADQTGLGTWAATNILTSAIIGASSLVPAQVFSGNLAEAVIFDRELTASEVLTVATPI